MVDQPTTGDLTTIKIPARQPISQPLHHFETRPRPICDAAEIPRKLDAPHQRCAEVGRDPKTLETSFLAFVFVDTDGDRARKLRREQQERSQLDDAQTDRQFAGDPDDVAE
ncbi:MULTISPECIES: hypothetical protein [Nocardia]|uniref:hypothetical protein n=1 Tax=Nocardia TaxID=1817 RepID=UPI003558FCDF